MTIKTKFLIILGAGPDQIPMYLRAKHLNIKTIGIDFNKNAPGFKYCDIKVISSAKHTDQVITALDKLQASGIKFSGITTLGMEISPIIAEVGDRYSLITVSKHTAMLTTNKCERNTALFLAGVDIPRYQIVKNYRDIRIPLPFVVKPSDSSGSRGVRRVDFIPDISSAFNEAKQHSGDSQVLVESLLSGPEISIEGFMVNGKMFVTGFADRNYLPNSPTDYLFIENGSNSPSQLPKTIQERAKDIFTRSAVALGLIDGPCKGDLLVTDGKVIVIEITSRLSGGGFCSRIVPTQTGVNIIDSTIKWATGLQISEHDFIPQHNKHVCHRFFLHDAGRITHISGIDEARKIPGVVDVVKQYDFRIGDKLEKLNYINRLLYVITTGNTRREATELAEKILRMINIIVDI